jgi:hypothetical protein
MSRSVLPIHKLKPISGKQQRLPISLPKDPTSRLSQEQVSAFLRPIIDKLEKEIKTEKSNLYSA